MPILNRLKNVKTASSVLFLTFGGLFIYSVFADLYAQAAESEGIYYIALPLRAMIKEQKRSQLPSKQELIQWSQAHGRKVANDTPDLAWEGMSGAISDTPQRAIVWSQRALVPFWQSYYNVLFDDTSIRRVPASSLKAVLNGQAFTLNERYECLHRCK